MAMDKFQATIWIESYIAQPYWPEMNDVIEIQKRSGMNLVRSDDKRAERLNAHLKTLGISKADYSELVRLSQRRWYRVDNADGASEIVIPTHQFSGMLVQAVKSAPSGSKLPVDGLRSSIRCSSFATGKTKMDRLYRRYVKSDQSNQRRLQEDEVIMDFEAKGMIEFYADDIKPAGVDRLLEHALTRIGCGAARKMGFGRGRLIELLPAVGE